MKHVGLWCNRENIRDITPRGQSRSMVSLQKRNNTGMYSIIVPWTRLKLSLYMWILCSPKSCLYIYALYYNKKKINIVLVPCRSSNNSNKKKNTDMKYIGLIESHFWNYNLYFYWLIPPCYRFINHNIKKIKIVLIFLINKSTFLLSIVTV